MTLVACGINHKNTPIHLREKFIIQNQDMPAPLHSLKSHTNAQEIALLSTCNRTEIYCDIENTDSIIDWIHCYYPEAANDILPHWFWYKESDAVKHMIRVASGLDSMLIGEPQIFGQMKTAYTLAVSAGTIGPRLQKLFQYIFSSSKKIRHDTNVGKQAISIAYASIQLAKHIFSSLSSCNVLTIGAGDTIQLVLKYLRENNVQNLWIANRTLEKAEKLAQEYQGQAISLANIPAYLAQAHIVVAATTSPLAILGKGSIERALTYRKHRPMLLIDLGVPRNIEPEAASIDDVYLYAIDHLQNIIESNLADRKIAAEQAERMIEQQTNDFMAWLDSLNGTAILKAYRQKIQSICDNELTKSLLQLQNGQDPEMIIRALSHNLSNKISHLPTTKIRNSAIDKQTEVLALTKYLFDLEE